MPKRFAHDFLVLVALVLSSAFVHAASPARQTPQPGCDRNLADATAGIAAMQARIKNLGTATGPEVCTATRLYFLEVVKARAVTALCKSGADRERDLGRFDADVEHINEAIATRCL